MPRTAKLNLGSVIQIIAAVVGGAMVGHEKWRRDHKHKKKAGGRFNVRLTFKPKKKGRRPMISVELMTNQKAVVALAPVDANGTPRGLDGPAVYTSDSPSVVCNVTTPDGLNCELVPADDASGVVNVQVSADADLGQGVETITETFELTITQPHATNLGATVSVVPK